MHIPLKLAAGHKYDQLLSEDGDVEPPAAISSEGSASVPAH